MKYEPETQMQVSTLNVYFNIGFVSKKTITKYFCLFRNKSDDYLFFFTLEIFKNCVLKPVFLYTTSICICVLNGYCVVEKMVLNVGIKDFS